MLVIVMSDNIQTTLNDFYIINNINIKEKDNELNLINKLDKIDWSSKGYKTQYLTHKFHPYPARFIPQIPSIFMRLFTNPHDIILDPFCGCGTTNVEALLNNRHSIGIDLNPLAVLIAKVKVTPLSSREITLLDRIIDSIKVKFKKYECGEYKLDYEEIIHKLPKRKISKYFIDNPDLTAKLMIIKESIKELLEQDEINVANFLKVALSATIWSITENKGKISVNRFFDKVKMMKEEIINLKSSLHDFPITLIIEGDARFLPLDDNVVDLIVTSPPYVNALDYHRIHMYSMFWLDLDFKKFRKHEIGAHSHFIHNRFRLLSKYLGDILRALLEMNRVLKDSKFTIIVVGNSIIEYEFIESWKFISDMASKVGFKLIKVYHRPIDPSRKYTSRDIGNINDEYIIILQKVKDVNINVNDNNFIANIVCYELEKFFEQVKRSPGSGVVYSRKKPSKDRLEQNIEKLKEAITNVKKDISIT